MKYLKFILGDMKVKLINEKRVCFIILFALAITVATCLVLYKGLMKEMGDAQHILESKRTYQIGNFSTNKNGISCYDSILHANQLPKVNDPYPLDVEECEVKQLAKGIAIGGNGGNFKGEALLPETVPKDVTVVSGRFFTDEELKNGAFTVVLSKNCLAQKYADKQLGDTIKIAEKTYRIIGVTKEENNNFILFETIKKSKLESEGKMSIIAGGGPIFVFEKELTQQQKNYLSDIVNSQSSIEEPIKSMYEMNSFGQLMTVLLYTGLLLLLVGFCMVNVITLFRYFAAQSQYETAVLKICGASNKFIALLMVAESFGMIVISYIIGMLLFEALLPLQLSLGLDFPIPPVLPAILFGGVIIITLVAYLPFVKRVSKLPPIRIS